MTSLPVPLSPRMRTVDAVWSDARDELAHLMDLSTFTYEVAGGIELLF